MTVAEINAALYMAFRAMYPTCNVHVVGAGTEEIQVSIQFGTVTIIHWTCELDSDDDGFFYFYLADTTLCVKVPYPE